MGDLGTFRLPSHLGDWVIPGVDILLNHLAATVAQLTGTQQAETNRTFLERSKLALTIQQRCTLANFFDGAHYFTSCGAAGSGIQ